MNLFKRLLKWKVVTLVIFSFVFFVGFILNNISKDQTNLVALVVKSPPPPPTEEREEENLSVPVRFKIPKINIDTKVEFVGLNVQGEMDVPTGPDEVGWFNLGPIPGEQGNSIIGGHSGWKNGIPAVFDNLYKLKKGDKIYVEDKKGMINTFIVRENRMYGSTTDVTEVYTPSDEKAHLNLITCAGSWNEILKSYSDRLVVFADKE